MVEKKARAQPITQTRISQKKYAAGYAHRMKEAAGPQFTLVSTYTNDRLPLGNGEVRVQRGGPAHYMGLALSRLCVHFQLVTGKTADVEVIPGPDGEKYMIPKLHPIAIPDPLPGDAVVLSPIMREIAPDSVPDVDGLLALDLQGFVRRPGDPEGGFDHDVDLAGLLGRADVIKAAEPELAALTPESRRAARSAIVLITHGDQGATIQQGDRVEKVKAIPVAAPNTIGAGDTFLSAFLVGLLQGHPPRAAGEDAARFVEGILRERLRR